MNWLQWKILVRYCEPKVMLIRRRVDEYDEGVELIMDTHAALGLCHRGLRVLGHQVQCGSVRCTYREELIDPSGVGWCLHDQELSPHEDDEEGWEQV